MYIVEWEFNDGEMPKKRGTLIEDRIAEAYPNFRALITGHYMSHLTEAESGAAVTPKKTKEGCTK
jgi:hypothetical protein